MRLISILISFLFLQLAHAQGMSFNITIGDNDYGDYNFTPFVPSDPSGSSSGNPFGPPGGNGGGFQRARQPSLDMQLYAPEDHPSVVAYRNRVQEEGRKHAAQINAKAAEIQAEIQKMIASSQIRQAVIARKYRDLYVKQGTLERKDIDYLVGTDSIRGVIRPHELPIADQDDGLNPYRDQVYGVNTTLNERKIIWINNFHNHAFREARWDNLQRMKRGDDLAVFESVEHFQAVELLSRANIYYSNRFLNKDNPSKEDMRIGHSLLDDAKSVGDFAMGVSSGVKTTVVDTVKGIPTLVRKTYSAIKNYEQTIDQINRLIEQFDSEKFYSAVGNFFENKWDQFIDGDDYTKGEMIGALSTEIASLFIPGTAVVKVAANATKYTIPIAKTITKTRIGEFLNSAQKLGLRASDEIQGAGRFLRNTLGNEVDATGNIEALLTQAGCPGLLSYAHATKKMADTGLNISKDANRFLANQTRYGETILGKGKNFSQDDLVRIASSYEALSRNIDKVTPININAEVWRAVPEIIKDRIGNIIARNASDTVFNFHKGIKASNGRYSAPGDSALYTSMGQKTDAWQTVLEELGDYTNHDLILHSKHYRLDKVLDLTDPNTRNILNINISDILYDSKKFEYAYEVTHQIGNIAKQKGLQGIKAPSAASEGGINLIILGE